MELSAAQRTMFERALRAGSGNQGVALSDSAACALVATVASDLALFDPHFSHLGTAPADFFSTEPREFGISTSADPLVEFRRLVEVGPIDSDTFFTCLATLHKARLKYETILATQPIPTFEQVGPRGLLQYGRLETAALTVLLFLRKWMYDIDNRAAQETGYLFEPIIAAAIGGTPVSASKSPVKRSSGVGTRQVDCIREDRAYEFKLRVTIAASGQGRWQEELSFPVDAMESGFTPVLIVFDGTENPKLSELKRVFQSVGGEAHIGTEAWAHLEDVAGSTMSVFLEKYVRTPLQDLLELVPGELPRFSLELDDEHVTFDIGGHLLRIDRTANDGFDGGEGELISDDADEALPGMS